METAEHRWYGKVDLVVAEIEDPRHHPVVGDIDPKRRVTFYARRGARVVMGPYFQPRLDGEGRKRVYHLFLTVLGGSGEVVSAENWVPTGILQDFLIDYFRDSGEGKDFPHADDREGNWLLAWYRDRETVSLHPIGDYAHLQIPDVHR
jgi:hypothetical protein